EVFGSENFAACIGFKKTSVSTSGVIPAVADHLLWYGRDKQKMKVNRMWLEKELGGQGGEQYTFLEITDGSRRRMTRDERRGEKSLPEGARVFRADNLTSSHEYALGKEPFKFQGRSFTPGSRYWSTSPEGLSQLERSRRLIAIGNTLSYVRYIDDFPLFPLTNLWTDTAVSGFGETRLYVVQTNPLVIERCVLMTSEPGDLVLDPTCGSGTTAYVAERWGRRWITIDTSRVPLALARQRLLTATYDWYDLQDDARGPAAGFVYRRKQNSRGEDVGGIVPHITLRSVANSEPPAEEVLIDRAETITSITRVSGPFSFEATIPTPVDYENVGVEGNGLLHGENGSFVDRMLEVLRRSPLLRLEGNRTVALSNIRPPTKALTL